MNFSFCVISRDEEETLPRLISSLKPFQEAGGVCCLMDTGSTDNTVKIAREAGWKVEEVGEKFLHTIDAELAKNINERFIVKGEEECVNEGDKYFDFASARNECAEMSPTDWVFWADCDEVVTKMDIEKIGKLIDTGEMDQFLYEFVFSHRQDGSPAVKFTQSKAYNRKNIYWKNMVHEVLQIKSGCISKGEKHLSEDIFLLEHYQIPHDRHSYLKGLAVDCYSRPEDDRASHYFSRELMWADRPHSAIKEFKRHVEMNGWGSERGQSCIFIGDCYGKLNQPDEQVVWYTKAFHVDSSRREALLRLAEFYAHNNNHQAVVCYAKAALEIPWHGFYANNREHYEDRPHALLYHAYGWLGNIPEAQKHINEALKYQPYNEKYLQDTKYYFEYQYPSIEGWMTWEELLWLYNTSKKMNKICEIGSWKGRSTHALASGGRGIITAIDTWEGSDDTNDLTNKLAKQEDIHAIFWNNMKGFTNIKTIKATSDRAARHITDGSIDMIFIDALHTHEGVKKDIELWLPKAKNIICGHDYCPAWPGVMQAVDEAFGKPDEVHGSIWVKYI